MPTGNRSVRRYLLLDLLDLLASGGRDRVTEAFAHALLAAAPAQHHSR